MGWSQVFEENGVVFTLTNFTSSIDFLIKLSDEEVINIVKTRDHRLFEAIEAVLNVKDELVAVKEVEEHGVDYYFRNGLLDTQEKINIAHRVLNSRFTKEETKEEIEQLLPKLYKSKAYEDRKHRSTQTKAIGKSGLVYLIRADLDNQPYKIGWTKNLDKRAKLFEVNLPFNFEVIHSFEADNARKAEASLHKIYAKKRLNGEWFDLAEYEVESIKAILEYRNSKFLVQTES